MSHGQSGAAPTGPPRQRSADGADRPVLAPEEQDSYRLGITEQKKDHGFFFRFATEKCVAGAKRKQDSKTGRSKGNVQGRASAVARKCPLRGRGGAGPRRRRGVDRCQGTE